MSEVRTLAVVGAGNMGSGIAQKMATEGFRVILVDLAEAQLERGVENIKKTLAEGVARKIFKEQQAADIQARIRPTTDWSELKQAELVVEAVFEDLDVKKDVFRRLAANTTPEAVLGSNTSSFYVRDLAAVTPHPERVVGLHYFYHPAKNRLVEVVPTKSTSKAALEKAQAVQDAIGKTSIVCADAPGFVVNRFFVPWLNEAVRLLAEGVADLATIEAVAKKAFGIGMGPFELMNVTGVPIALHAAGTLGRELGKFYEPSPRLKQQVDAKQNWELGGTADMTKMAVVSQRLMGQVLLVAGALVDEKVGTIEDVDIGARVGLRWPLGPFELANQLGVAEAARLAEAVGKPWGLALPGVFRGRTAPFTFKLVDTSIADRIATITINRPDKLNALNEEVVAQLATAFDRASGASDVDAIVITGKGKAFVAGADIGWFVQKIEQKRIPDIATFTRGGQELLQRFGKSPKVVIAKLDGLSLGGSELALACDYIVATKKASFGFPETGIGIYPGLGGTQRLARRIGVDLAKAFIFTGNGIGADAAAKLGVVDQLVTHEQMAEAIRGFIKRGKPAPRRHPSGAPAGFEGLAALFHAHPVEKILAGAAAANPDDQKQLDRVRTKAPVALRISEALIDASAKLDLDAGLEKELSHLEEIFSTADAYTGLTSLGKARPVFHGK